MVPENITALERLCVVFALAVVCVASSACGHSSMAGPSGTPTVNGTWKGTGTDIVEGSQYTWVLTQTAGNVTGTSTFVGVSSGFNANGPITGTVAGSTFTFTFTISFAAPFQFCTATASGSAQVSNSNMTGSYTGTNSCEGGPFTSGQFTLTRQ